MKKNVDRRCIFVRAAKPNSIERVKYNPIVVVRDEKTIKSECAHMHADEEKQRAERSTRTLADFCLERTRTRARECMTD
jgi:hypothetical protein